MSYGRLPINMAKGEFHLLWPSAPPSWRAWDERWRAFRPLSPPRVAPGHRMCSCVRRMMEEVLGHSSVPLFENYILQDPKAFFVLAGIVFDHTFNDSKQPLPLKVKYRLRFSYTQRNSLIAQLTSKQDYVDSWGTSFLYPPNPSQEPRALGHSDGGLPGYSNEGFLAIQHALDKAIMHYHAHNGTTEMFEGLSVLVKRFPHGAHIQDRLLVTLQNEFPLLLMLSFICIELIIINSIALEKEKKLKEYMCMMGVDNWQHWAAWFIVSFVSALLAVSFMTVLFCTQVNSVAVFRNSDPSLIFVFLLSFATATVFLAFMISTFFQKAKSEMHFSGLKHQDFLRAVFFLETRGENENPSRCLHLGAHGSFLSLGCSSSF